MRAIVLTVALAATTMLVLEGQVSGQARISGGRVTTAHTCAAELGRGVKSRRNFCDIVTTSTPSESIVMTIPARTGAATLMFDLHNRFDLPAVEGFPGASYTRHEAIVRVIQPDGTVIGRGAVVREYRTTADLFDQLAGGGRPGGVKAVAPGPAEAVRFSIPAGVSSIGIVGEQLRVRTGLGGNNLFDAPGRPVAIASNIRLEYRPR
jgi:hypothetical protein